MSATNDRHPGSLLEKRSAPSGAGRARMLDVDPEPDQSALRSATAATKCAHCKAILEGRHPTCRYCSGRCRAAASLKRRVTAAVENALRRSRSEGGEEGPAN
jgi:hypothetical protein